MTGVQVVRSLVTWSLLGFAASGLAACGSGDAGGGGAPSSEARPRRVEPAALSAPAPPAAAPGALSGGTMWASGAGGGGGGGGRSLAREAHDRNRRERIARMGPLSERREDLVRQGQEVARALAAGLPEGQLAALSSPNPDQTPAEAVRQRCTALLEMNRDALAQQGDARGTTGPAFLARCQTYPEAFWNCIDRGDEGRSDRDCNSQFARLDRETRELRREGRDVAHPEQRIDSLVEERWDSERQPIAPAQVTPD